MESPIKNCNHNQYFFNWRLFRVALLFEFVFWAIIPGLVFIFQREGRAGGAQSH